MGRDLLVGAKRVGDAEEREIRRRFAGPGFLDDRADRAAVSRLADEFVAVEIFATEGNEEIARAGRAGVGADVGDETAAVAVLANGFGELRELIEGERIMARLWAFRSPP